ncbi:MAG: hypothetical protein A2W71_01830 [Candidatus Nealsonbacteria bacterium RIFCSPLOWO2_02_39_8]|uniref:POTRA domain-containing protein n=3 Tax=Parcubacteria group TaxID=1794811 RepID=A0A1G2EGC1_9BACT|nr:MAG: hypothetical protein UV72_C0004G0029 [Candidatus Giovannonibacteria bacterium GW2011_GWB1_43_13]KKS99340.1 MAG: hypothetical protein UV75_C0006G0029 [Candidatus Giovannonibacteria bacterium GW2011_GWA1_43_15]KKT21716.1 MAG: hypothetical protein UW05_C0004G0010 [Candidatus Giovannonibacteria bacterium GW2011_GWC2_43_8]KKT63314.1 MAG: hypothetical protein UW55_C0005G0029 [Candidatus Giovannonibacteria bacterium GW2011_GWA2_44_26]OGF59240.1 MAG: hypothetical protein A2652_00870 [Candidatus
MELADYYKKRRRRQFIGKAVIFGWGLLLIFFLVWGFFWIPYLRVANIKVEGYQDENSVKIALADYLSSRGKFFLPQNNFFLLNIGDVKRILKEKGFDLQDVSKQIPNTLLIRFISMPSLFIFCQDKSSCFYVNSSGVLGERAPRFSESPLLELAIAEQIFPKIGDQIFSEQQARFLGVFLDSLKNLNLALSKIEISGNKDIKIFTKEGWHILTSSDLDADRVSQDLQLLISQKIADNRSRLEYIDMRFPNKAFYKLKN